MSGVGGDMDKAAAAAALRAVFKAELSAVTSMAAAAYDEATHAESKAENKYDTRSLEASYLAAGQARRVNTLRSALGFFDTPEASRATLRVGIGSLVAVDDGSQTTWYFVAPEGGGTTAEVEGTPVRVLTPGSPLGRNLLGSQQGEAVMRTQPTPLELEILEVQ